MIVKNNERIESVTHENCKCRVFCRGPINIRGPASNLESRLFKFQPHSLRVGCSTNVEAAVDKTKNSYNFNNLTLDKQLVFFSCNKIIFNFSENILSSGENC